VTLQISNFQGGPAFSSFKTRRLLSRLQSVCAAIQSLQATHVYLLAVDRPLKAADSARLAQLLDAVADKALPVASADTLTLVVSPRQGTVSPWASKAGDIARNCGFGFFQFDDTGGGRAAVASESDAAGEQPDAQA
jgi:phosphoribosylformylglycinamidine synthase